jgi:hypothetical protein
MKRITGIVAGAFVLALSTSSFAQQSAPDGTVILKQRMLSFQGQDGAPPPPPDANFVFLASESFGGKVVKGAPYSAEAVTETIQTLSDGNRIINKFSSSVYRDSEGRTRREQSFKGLGVLGVGEEPLKTIFIHDPVAGVSYSLDARTHTAHKSTPFTFQLNSKGGSSITTTTQSQTFEFKVGGPGGASGNVIMTAPLGAGPEAARVPPPGVEHFTLRTETAGAAAYVFSTGKGPNTNEKKEDLGKQNIEGVEAEGTRTTVTIPAGEIGNERAIEIVSERWYSPELQLVVMTRHSDPRMGETTYKLTNISRTEPAKSLFEVPSDYTIKSGIQAPLRRKLTHPEE